MRFLTYITRPFGEKGGESPADLEWPETARKETGLGSCSGGDRRLEPVLPRVGRAAVVSISH